ncbi:MAG: cupin [Candidatus Latescibacterota bacterium]|nr:cupin [Candidatus Latescibacterota bacterium]
MNPRPIALADDGLIPNSLLPLLVYAAALGEVTDRAVAFEALFAGNGWSRSWRNGIYAFRHYHSTAHEVLGIAAGWAHVEFGGPQGVELDVQAGDAVLIPAGVSHYNLGASDDLLVIGSYLDGSESADLRRDTEADRAASLARIAALPIPPRDPVLGEGGLPTLWS